MLDRSKNCMWTFFLLSFLLDKKDGSTDAMLLNKYKPSLLTSIKIDCLLEVFFFFFFFFARVVWNCRHSFLLSVNSPTTDFIFNLLVGIWTRQLLPLHLFFFFYCLVI